MLTDMLIWHPLNNADDNFCFSFVCTVLQACLHTSKSKNVFLVYVKPRKLLFVQAIHHVFLHKNTASRTFKLYQNQFTKRKDTHRTDANKQSSYYFWFWLLVEVLFKIPVLVLPLVRTVRELVLFMSSYISNLILYGILPLKSYGSPCSKIISLSYIYAKLS